VDANESARSASRLKGRSASPWARIEIREIRVPLEGVIRVPWTRIEIREIRVPFERGDPRLVEPNFEIAPLASR